MFGTQTAETTAPTRPMESSVEREDRTQCGKTEGHREIVFMDGELVHRDEGEDYLERLTEQAKVEHEAELVDRVLSALQNRSA